MTRNRPSLARNGGLGSELFEATSDPRAVGCPKTSPLRCSQLADSPGVRIADIGAHKQMFLGVTKFNPDVYHRFLNIMVPHSNEGSSAGVRRPQRLAKNSANSFFLARTSGTAK